MEQKIPYVKPSLETIDVKTLTETVGPVQALASGQRAAEPATSPQRLTNGGTGTFKRR